MDVAEGIAASSEKEREQVGSLIVERFVQAVGLHGELEAQDPPAVLHVTCPFYMTGERRGELCS